METRKLYFDKDTFCRLLYAVKAQEKADLQRAKYLGKVFKNAFEPNLVYDNSLLRETLIDVLCEAAGEDRNAEFGSTIDYFIDELKWGTRKDLGVWVKDEKVDLSSVEKLYDFLIGEVENDAA